MRQCRPRIGEHVEGDEGVEGDEIKERIAKGVQFLMEATYGANSGLLVQCDRFENIIPCIFSFQAWLNASMRIQGVAVLVNFQENIFLDDMSKSLLNRYYNG